MSSKEIADFERALRAKMDPAVFQKVWKYRRDELLKDTLRAIKDHTDSFEEMIGVDVPPLSYEEAQLVFKRVRSPSSTGFELAKSLIRSSRFSGGKVWLFQLVDASLSSIPHEYRRRGLVPNMRAAIGVLACRQGVLRGIHHLGCQTRRARIEFVQNGPDYYVTSARRLSEGGMWFSKTWFVGVEVE